MRTRYPRNRETCPRHQDYTHLGCDHIWTIKTGRGWEACRRSRINFRKDTEYDRLFSNTLEINPLHIFWLICILQSKDLCESNVCRMREAMSKTCLISPPEERKKSLEFIKPVYGYTFKAPKNKLKWDCTVGIHIEVQRRVVCYEHLSCSEASIIEI